MSKTKKRIALSCVFLCVILILSCMLLLFTGCEKDYKFDFDYEIDVTECIRGGQVNLKTTITNVSGFAHYYYGSSSGYMADAYLYTKRNGSNYVLYYNPIALSSDTGKHKIDNGVSGSQSFNFTIPLDAPLGEYNLVLSYKNSSIEYENVLTIKEGEYEFTFDYDIDVIECRHGSKVELTTTITNDSGYIYKYLGFSTSFRPQVCLYIEKDGDRYEIPIDFSDKNDLSYYEIHNGESRTISVSFEIPALAPLGEYNLVLSYSDSRIGISSSVEYRNILTVSE